MINLKCGFRKWPLIGLALLLVMGVFDARVQAQEGSPPSKDPAANIITDSFGRQLTLPSEVNRVLSTYPPVSTIIYMLKPESMVGWNFKPDTRNMPAEFQKLPVSGGWFGLWSGNYETMIDMHPDAVLYGAECDDPSQSELALVNERQEKFGAIPLIGVTNSAQLDRMDEAILLLGRVLGAEDRARDLVAAHQRATDLVVKRMAALPAAERVRVYYAEGPTGLLTDPEGSRHSVLIGLCGGTNVADCPIRPGMGQTEVSLEQVLAWNPAVIITENPKFFNSVYKNPLWGQIEAVKNHRVYLTPRGPFCWFDRPPGTTTILGLYWTAARLHPDQFTDIDLNQVTREFYRTFYHYDLSDQELADLLDPQKGISPDVLPHRPTK